MKNTEDTQQPEATETTNEGVHCGALSGRSVAVWQVVEWVEHGKVSREQSVYVLATSALEAAQIVGEDESREIRTVHQVCPLSQLPTDKYRPMLVAHKRRGGVVAGECPNTEHSDKREGCA